jgi:drug/metabolite transporter (DMT)-like permease
MELGVNYDLLILGITVAGIAILGFFIYFNDSKSVTNVSFLKFSIILLLGGAILPFMDHQVDPLHNMDLLYGTLILATTTLVGYLLQNFGVPLVGPSLASVIGASGPAVTALMALVLIDETLNLQQALGVFLVTLWVLGISVENMKKTVAPPPKK